MGGWGCPCEEVVEEGSFPATPAQLVRLGGRLRAMAAETEVKFKRVRIHSSIPKDWKVPISNACIVSKFM